MNDNGVIEKFATKEEAIEKGFSTALTEAEAVFLKKELPWKRHKALKVYRELKVEFTKEFTSKVVKELKDNAYNELNKTLVGETKDCPCCGYPHCGHHHEDQKDKEIK
jgi:hypothetical protein